MINEDNNSDKKKNIGKQASGRRRFLAGVGAAATATTVAGCLGGDDGDGGPVTIGHLAPLDNPLGLGSERSAEMAVEEINDDGGVMDREVDVLSRDTRGDPSQAQDETERLIQQEGVDVLVGTFVSEVTQGIIDLVAEFDVPFVVTGSAAPSTITEFVAADYDRYRNVFRTGPVNSDFQAEAMGDYAEYLSDRHGWNSFAFLADDAAWTLPFQNILPDALEEKGFDVAYNENLSIEIDDFGTVLDDVAESGADAIYRFFAHINGGPMLGQWHQLEYEFGVEGIHVASMLPAFFQLSEGAALYETTSQSGAGGVTDITEKTVPFTEAYAERYAEEDPPSKPMYMGFNTYDGVYVYRDAVERAGTTDYENDLDAIVDAMLETDYTGTAGQIELYGEDAEYPHDLKESRGGDGVISNFPITQWQADGQLECVYPSHNRTADHVAPHWM